MSEHDDILIALRRISRAIDLRSKQLIKETGLTAPQLVAMQALKRDGAMSSSALSRAISLSPATMTAILSRLERSGLIERRKSQADKRVTTIVLTAAGEEALSRAPDLLQAGFIQRLKALQPWERSMLVASLQRVAEMMDAASLDAAPILASGDLGNLPADDESGEP